MKWAEKLHRPTFFIVDKAILQDVKSLVLPILEAQGIELVDLLIKKERGRAVLQVLADKPRLCAAGERGKSGGITLDECAQLNQQISQVLDRENLIQERYCLEISSPGLDRPLRSTRDFQRLQGQLIKVVLHEPVDTQNVWQGYLEEVNEEKIALQTTKHKRLTILRKNIARAKLEVDFD